MRRVALAALAALLLQPGIGAQEAAEEPSAPLGRAAAFGVIDVEPTVEVQAGTALRSRPDPRAEALVRFEVTTQVPVLERRGRWVRTHHRDANGWLAPGGEPTIEEYHREAIEAGYLVVNTSPAERAARIASARRLLGAENAAFPTLGGWSLHTDVTDELELRRLDNVARQLRRAYEERYGLRPSDEPIRAVVLYRDEHAYRRFAGEFTDIGELHGDGHADDSMAVLFLAANDEVDSASVLVHELTHLMNRDVFQGTPATWIEEGLANDLGLSRIDPDGGFTAATLGVRNTARTTSGGQFVWTELLRQWRDDRAALLPVTELLDLSWSEFVNDRHRRWNYALSTFFVRYLLDASEPAVSDGFRRFLASVSRGGPSGSEALATELGTTPAELRSGFERWLTQSAAANL